MQGLRVVGVDPNPEMAPYAVQAAEEAGLSREQLQLMDGTAQQLPVPSHSQDAVVCTLVSTLLLVPLVDLFLLLHPPVICTLINALLPVTLLLLPCYIPSPLCFLLSFCPPLLAMSCILLSSLSLLFSGVNFLSLLLDLVLFCLF